MELRPIKEIKPNPDNPRVIRDEKFTKLKTSIQEFPEMLKLRPIVVDENDVILGGNQRYRALQELKHKEVWTIKASELTEAQKREFIIKDNVGFGEHNWDVLANEWDAEQLTHWGLDIPNFEPELDYSILDEEDIDSQLQDMANGVKKAIQIEFHPDHYEEAYELIKFWRDKGGYVGKMILDFLKSEKEKL